ncbi:ABC transporter substrate-binding protein [Roseibacterium sp. SDUM158016]|jgi:alpha-glucoside transport system substrate-binding protein|uniref:ABC transporter substrate-binding protein n=1 Tax=Roseicyclus sediminis TaxID=2980997 RepID=UPI0021D1B1E2|nr:ABC transporter substrate-binding protein [Roseibacterium sp. SDUM158016]MCU4652651.1 ABC transporter substrate-binding protein [Roseibacterium sp. SDUM158016]
MTSTTSTFAILAATLAAPAFAQDQLPFTPGEGPFSWESLAEFAAAHDYTGEQVTIAAPWLGPDADAAVLVLRYFEQATGATVRVNGSDAFEQQIVIDVEAGSPPNIAVFPQPGLMCDLARRGRLADLGEDTAAWMTETYAAGPSWTALGSCAGLEGFFGFSYNVNVKSLVWYNPENFADQGYVVPTSMEDLRALTERMVEDGVTPWCIGLGSGAATGWPATDWVEDMLLRTQPPEVYDAWVVGEIPFDDPRIVAAIEEFGWFARNDAFVSGGASAVSSTDFRDSPLGLFSAPPQCMMHRQASFIPAFFPEGTVVGEDVDFFYFPAYAQADLGNPVLGAGTLVSITDDTPAARGLIEFLKTPMAHELWMAIETQGFLTPHTGVALEAYHNDSLLRQGRILQEATTFRFDGSDLMPGAIGAGSFWTGMVDYTGGADAASVARSIAQSWDALN